MIASGWKNWIAVDHEIETYFSLYNLLLTFERNAFIFSHLCKFLKYKNTQFLLWEKHVS